MTSETSEHGATPKMDRKEDRKEGVRLPTWIFPIFLTLAGTVGGYLVRDAVQTNSIQQLERRVEKLEDSAQSKLVTKEEFGQVILRLDQNITAMREDLREIKNREIRK